VTNGAELADRLVATRSVAGVRVLVPRAEDGREDAIRILRAAGAEVDDVIAYRTVPTRLDDPRLVRGRDALAGVAKVCAVFAPSQVGALEAVVGPLTALACRFAAIGSTTAAALRGRGVSTVAVAPAPTPEGLAQALRGWE
jgi:uroporphyrinogen-III synthase